MSICDSGVESKVKAGEMTIRVYEDPPLLILASLLPWRELYEMVLPDLKKTTKRGMWWLGRKLKVGIHLAAFIVQQLYNLTDRKVEYGLKDNAAYQIFCGRTIVKNWHAPDHTKIEKFRSRLSPQTQRNLANKIAFQAEACGIADASQFDIDSTPQEANMTYPTDAKMLRKLGMLANKVSKALKNRVLTMPEINIQDIAMKAKNCFFQKRYSGEEEKSSRLKELWDSVSSHFSEVIEGCKLLTEAELKRLTWPIRRAMKQLLDHGEKYLQDALTFIETGRSVEGKQLSFHLNEVGCFNKGKAHKKYEFGRVYQLGRIGGNFFIAGACTSIEMNDKKAVIPMLDEHEKLFGQEVIQSLATDKGYYSKKNVKAAQNKGVKMVGIQQPENIKQSPVALSQKEAEILYNRRSGIEPLIGHIKQGGQLGQSRMKSDSTIEASGYSSVLGFNLRQTIRAFRKREKEDHQKSQFYQEPVKDAV